MEESKTIVIVDELKEEAVRNHLETKLARPQTRKDKLLGKAARLLEQIVAKNKETKSLTDRQVQVLVDRTLKARTKELTGEISYLTTIYKTL